MFISGTMKRITQILWIYLNSFCIQNGLQNVQNESVQFFYVDRYMLSVN